MNELHNAFPNLLFSVSLPLLNWCVVFPSLCPKEKAKNFYFLWASSGEEKRNRETYECHVCMHTHNKQQQNPVISPLRSNNHKPYYSQDDTSYRAILANVWKRTNQPELIYMNEMSRNKLSLVFTLPINLISGATNKSKDLVPVI